jgi:hypothetical protein
LNKKTLKNRLAINLKFFTSIGVFQFLIVHL